MNTIYIKKNHINTIIKSLQYIITQHPEYVGDFELNEDDLRDEEDNQYNRLVTFYKQNKKIIPYLNNIFPSVLSPIIMSYHKEEIEVEYCFDIDDDSSENKQYTLDIYIHQYEYNITITLIEKPNRYGNFVLKSSFSYDVFGINRRMNPLVCFNEFMLKYYNKKSYFDNFLSNQSVSALKKKPKYTNCRQLKYCIIITKIIIDIIQNTNLSGLI